MASLGGAIGALGPIIGTTAGGIFGLASAFGVAGIAAVGYGSLAAGSISKVIEANGELRDLQSDLANATNEEERSKILAEMESITKNLSSEQQKSLKSVQSLSSAWGDLQKRIEPDVMYAFSGSLQAIETVMSSLTPMIDKTAGVVSELVDSLNANIKAKDMTAFFDFLNRDGASILSDIAKAAGNFGAGLINMMTAFGPLSKDMADGFKNMGADFRKWAGGLSESDKFQSFINYIRDNGPKVLGIIGGIATGVVDMFSAFGPLASDMLDGLLGMVDGFKEWASTLSDNKGFQAFTDFVREQGPLVLDFFAQLRDFLINLGIGFAKVSEVMTPFLTNLFDMFNGIMENNPWVAELVGWITTLTGVVGLVLYPIMLFTNLLIGLIAPFKKIFEWIGTKIIPKFTNLTNLFKDKVIPWISRLWQWFLKAGPTLAKVGGFFSRFLTGPVGWIITGIATLATVIWQHWDSIWKWTKDTFSKMGEKVEETWAKIVLAFGVVAELYNKVKSYFGKIKDEVGDKMSNVWDTITNTWDDVMDFLKGINLKDIGSDIISGLANGITNAKDKVTGAIGKVVNDAIEWARGLLDSHSPSRVFIGIGNDTGEGFAIGITDMAKRVRKASEYMTGAAIHTPQAVGATSSALNAEVYPSKYNAQSSFGETSTENYYFEGMLSGANFTVREEADVDRIAEQLAKKVKKTKKKNMQR
ncbi:phage tail protein [Oceanobacillus kimchii]|uniref:phage tail protein n=1 Tax=Oceanobacillus kimchii TaxID=746691 RepID=UPI003B0281DF